MCRPRMCGPCRGDRAEHAVLFLFHVLIDSHAVPLQMAKNFLEDAEVGKAIDVMDDSLVDEHILEQEVEEHLGEHGVLVVCVAC